MATRRDLLSMFGTAALALSVGGCGIIGTAQGATSNDGAAASPRGPLDEIMATVWGNNLTPEELALKFDAQNKRREELIAQCLTRAGFEYIPNPGTVGITNVSDNMWRPDDRDWVVQYGYGMTYSPWNDVVEAPVAENTYVDPNAAYLDSLSDSERDAFYVALYGPPNDGVPSGIVSDDGQIIDMEAFVELQGCWGKAQYQIDDGSRDRAITSTEFAPLFDAMNKMHEDLWNNVSEPEQDWAACMAGAGYPNLERQYEAQNLISDEQQEFYTDFDWDNWDFDKQGSPSPANTPALAIIGQHELEVALADLNCRESVNYRARMEARQVAAETQFIQDNRAALDALLAVVAQFS